MQAQPLLTQSQFLMGIGESNQFADAFEDCRLPQERAKVALATQTPGNSRWHGREFPRSDGDEGRGSREGGRIEWVVIRQKQALEGA